MTIRQMPMPLGSRSVGSSTVSAAPCQPEYTGDRLQAIRQDTSALQLGTRQAATTA